MTTIVKLRKYHSGFINVANSYAVADGAAEGDEYKGDFDANFVLPDGYRVAENSLGEKGIYNAAGEHCSIVEHMTGLPQLIDNPLYMPVLEQADKS